MPFSTPKKRDLKDTSPEELAGRQEKLLCEGIVRPSLLSNNTGTKPKTTPLTTKMSELEMLLAKQTQLLREDILKSEERLKAQMTETMSVLQEKFELLAKENEQIKVVNKQLQQRIEDLEKRERRNRIVITGIKAENVIEARKELNLLTKRTMGKEVDLRDMRVFRTRAGPRVVAECSSFEVKMEIVKNKRTFKRDDGRPVFVDDDYTQAEQIHQRKLREIAKDKRSEGWKVSVGYRKINIDGKWFQFDEETEQLKPVAQNKTGLNFA